MRAATVNSTNRDVPDAELAHLIAAGDQDAFVLLMRRYNRALYRTARSIMQDDAEAEDVLQEAYLLAYRGIARFRGDARLSTWLTRIVMNEAIARRRKTRRSAEVIRFGDDIDMDAIAPEGIMTDHFSEPPERAALRAEARRILEKKIDELPDAFRTVFMLRALEEMTVDEVAACLDIPEATVRTRFFRARSLLREALSREIDFALEEAFAFAGARCDRIVAGVLRRLGDEVPGDAEALPSAHIRPIQ